MKQEKEIIAIKDKDLRRRMESLVASSGGQITLTDIMRAAIYEKLDQLEKSGTFSVRLTPPPIGEKLKTKSRRANTAGGS